MNKVRVFNMHSDVVPPGAKYIGRGTSYGNPYRLGVHGNRDQVCNVFERDVLPKLNVEPLRGFDMVCSCNPARCHGHSIYKKLYGHDYNVNEGN